MIALPKPAPQNAAVQYNSIGLLSWVRYWPPILNCCDMHHETRTERSAHKANRRTNVGCFPSHGNEITALGQLAGMNNSVSALFGRAESSARIPRKTLGRDVWLCSMRVVS
jgi:hypothetical protein